MSLESLVIPKELYPSDPRFGAGPSKILEEDITALYETKGTLLGTGHRGKKVTDLIRSIQEKLCTYLGAPSGYEVLLGNGGATYFFDLLAFGSIEEKILHYTWGEFSQKWAQATKRNPLLSVEEKKGELGSCLPLEIIEYGHVDTMACTLNETSTGVMIPFFPQRQSALIYVDGTSGAGQIPCDLNKVDCLFFSPQKVFASEGGLFLAVVSPRFIERVEAIEKQEKRILPASFMFSSIVQNSRNHQTVNTCSLATLFLLNRQLERLCQKGFSQVHLEAKQKANHLYGWATTKPYLSCFVANPEIRSLTVGTIDVDSKIPVSQILEFLKQRNLAIDIAPYRKLGRNQFRISFFNNVTLEDLQKLTELISFVIEQRF